MRPANLPRASGPFIIVLALVALVLGACRTSQRPDIKTDPTIQPKTEPDSKVVAETPSLAGRIENVSMYPVPNHGEDLAVSLVVSVRNAGSPSIAEGWNLGFILQAVVFLQSWNLFTSAVLLICPELTVQK